MTEQATPAVKRGGSAGGRIALAVAVLVVVAIAGVVAWLASDRALPFLVAQIEQRSNGTISVEAPSGSIIGTMRLGRITWRSDDATLVADDVVVDWNPTTLLHRQVTIRALGARHVDIAVKPGQGGSAPPPRSLTLPVAIDIDRLTVGQLDWHAGPRSGTITGLALGYSGNADAHHIRDLALVSDYGALRGDLTLGARAPLPLKATVSIAGDGPIRGAHADITLDGPIERIGVGAQGAYRGASLALQAVATPFAAAPFASATAHVSGVDASTFDASLPATRANVVLAFSPRGDGIAGTLEATNETPAPIDANGVPVARLAGKFALDTRVLELDQVDAAFGGGEAHGDARITLDRDRPAVHLALAIANLDLKRVSTKLAATRLSGRITADADRDRQTLEGDVRERDMALAFAAAIAEERVEVSRFRLSAGGGSLEGSGQFALREANAFSVRATMAALDPSRFAAAPHASLDGTVAASGVLHPQLRAAIDLGFAPTSRIEGLALSGKAKGTIAAAAVEALAADVTLGSTHVTANGGAGTTNARLAFTLDAPRLDELAKLAPSGIPRPIAGALHASGHLALARDALGGDVTWRATALQAGDATAATLSGRASLAPGKAALASRAIAADIEATKLIAASRTIDTLHVTVNGTLARHRASLAVRDADVDATVALDGSLANVDVPSQTSFNATVTTLENRGSVPLRLDGPATVALRAHYARIENARIEVADGRASVREFIWNDGRITTQGNFTGIPVATVARLAGRTLPTGSTLVVGGDWSIAASPNLTGSFTLARERGDIFANVPSGATTTRQPIGVSELRIAGTFRDDALDARASFVSAVAGRASATLAIGTVNGAASGKIEPSAPLRLAVHGELASLAVFQPWFGTQAAIDGRAVLEVAASGTVGKPLWTGSLAGTALTVDAPQYGVHLDSGTLQAHLAQTGILIDALQFRGGDGTFEASGEIALPGAKDAATRVNWSAQRFRIANRPDLHFVVDGSGAIALNDRRLALRGRLEVVEGHIEFEPTPTGKLAPDIVIEGEPVASRESASSSVPVALDLEVDLGRKLTFEGEGLDARLAGRIHLTTDANGNLRASGAIRTVNGTYFAFGQKLTIDRGRVIFDGPVDNPALDVVALRKNLPVEAGVQITGTVKVPLVRITSNPPVPENEALAWLVTGQGLNTSGRIDYGALSAASAALLGRRGKPLTADVAQRLGLDEISLQSSGTATNGTAGTASQVVVFGKRISDRLSLGYEQGLSLASSAVRLEYALSRQVTLRAEAGTTSGVSIVYRRSFR